MLALLAAVHCAFFVLGAHVLLNARHHNGLSIATVADDLTLERVALVLVSWGAAVVAGGVAHDLAAAPAVGTATRAAIVIDAIPHRMCSTISAAPCEVVSGQARAGLARKLARTSRTAGVMPRVR